MERKQILIIVCLLALCAAILAFPLLTIHDSEFGGAAGAAEAALANLDPDYEPWAESILEPPGGETESMLFCLQAALGAVVIGYGFGYLTARKKYRTEEAA